MTTYLPRALYLALIVFALASLVHHVHNAEYLADYPNMPNWISPKGVYAGWFGVTAVGVLGVLLCYRDHQVIGLITLGAYAALGFDGLAHYGVAPPSAHSTLANFTIWFEVVAAAIVLVLITGLTVRRLRSGQPP